MVWIFCWAFVTSAIFIYTRVFVNEIAAPLYTPATVSVRLGDIAQHACKQLILRDVVRSDIDNAKNMQRY